MKTGRPRKQNRHEECLCVQIATKITPAEKEALEALVVSKNEEARKQGYSGVSISSLIRGLILTELERSNIVP